MSLWLSLIAFLSCSLSHRYSLHLLWLLVCVAVFVLGAIYYFMSLCLLFMFVGGSCCSVAVVIVVVLLLEKVNYVGKGGLKGRK